METQKFVLVDKTTGDEYTFTNRGAYLSALYSGGYKAAAPSQAGTEPPRPVRRERRDPVNDSPTVETAPGE